MARAAPAEPRPVRPPLDWRAVSRMPGFHRLVGLSIDPRRSGAGRCTVTGVVEARHLNINQVVHGGVYATILDTAMGGAVVTLLAPDEVTATTSLYVEFLRPAREGQHLVAQGEVVRRGRHLAFVKGDLLDGEGRRLSQAHGTWYIWSAGDGTWSGPPAKKRATRARPARRARTAGRTGP
ncbi:MAG: PaaI family thioesterase [Thermoplasmata archaeon]|nr:PaaI family thioesterase [Thermoplasmata archaeon]